MKDKRGRVELFLPGLF